MNRVPAPARRKTLLPYGRQWIDDRDIEAVEAVLRGDYLTTGPLIAEFESKFARAVGAEYAVAFSNGTAALHGACHAAGIGEGDEVITSPMTFAASANCVLYQRGKPVFADVDEETGNLDPASVAERITERTKTILPVHYAGQPARLDELRELAKARGLVVIEDAAHALGAVYKGRRIGSDGDMTMFSLHPVKHITTGEGGIIATNREDYYRKLLDFRNHGIVRDPSRLEKEPPAPWYYEMQSLGYNYRLTDFQAALGLSQLDKLELFVKRRKEIAARYDEAFRHSETVVIPRQEDGAESSWHLYVIRLRLDRLEIGRDEVFRRLLEENIGVQLHYIPVYLHPYYRRLGYPEGLCPAAERMYGRILSLPLYPAMTDKDAEDVVRAVQKATGT
ncbi:UDP-4-amino-4,6-dideoxy-N-acetyl-beta-L-altrosamine transaminase [Cohnella xylanilytica]|uniref:UDP-4-amino-4, 6-dideoxy-N-acetyl-beta-L-altrosamine transaminase n=1 Tax=Cohnella xylanilytica TaxID=557555 RepID=A0A841U0Z9_9BACL|nr:UDP-4-amino-4,6-dideoxy-N-acetyl-beta-L-altrosamine transaminase [Cohnella xylanilytica]MBB6692858.1 UDP-4-amino-4,6-dideoxy-N-acetyl-beta-L-altrosamine transaminase [Cohnella xylanilytica]